MTLMDINKPQGWTEKHMSDGWMRKVKTSADKRADKLKNENEQLKGRLDQLEQMVAELATKKGKK